MVEHEKDDTNRQEKNSQFDQGKVVWQDVGQQRPHITSIAWFNPSRKELAAKQVKTLDPRELNRHAPSLPATARGGISRPG